MKLTFPLLLSGVLSVGFSAYADNLEPIDYLVTGMSPDATTVIGVKGRSNTALFTSFTYDVEKGDLKWVTDGENYFGSHLDGGRFAAINEAGMIAGSVRNPEMRLPVNVSPYSLRSPKPINFTDDEEGEAITSAAIWRDGKLYVLGCGPYTIESFSDWSEGSAALGLTADGNTVFGNIMSGWMAIEGCVWEYDAEADAYDYLRLPVPGNALMSSIIATSVAGYPAAGAISVPTANGGFMLPILWTSADEYVEINVPELGAAYGVYANAISAGGKYMAISVDGPHPSMYVYNIEDAKYEKVTLPAGTTEVVGRSITDEGNMILTIQDGNFAKQLYYYELDSDTMVTLDEYLNDSMDYDPAGELAGATVVAMSGDGKNILLQKSSYSTASLLLTIDNPKLQTCPAPDDLDIYNTTPNDLEVRFAGITSMPEGCTLRGYKVYVDDQEIEEIEANELGGEFFVQAKGRPGSVHSAYVRTLYTKADEEKFSGKSPRVTCYVSADTSLFNFYDFDDASGDAQGNYYWSQDTWQPKMNYGVPGEFINWYITINDFENRTPAICTVAAPTEPWSTTFVSHFMDAAGVDNFYIDFRYQMRPINDAAQDFSLDFLSVEVTTDGRTWEPVGIICAGDIAPIAWHTAHFFLGDKVGDKMFQLRFNAHGEGIGQLQWNVDDIAIYDRATGEAPTGLRYYAEPDQAKLMWHNRLGLHDISYLDNSAVLWDYNVGNEGEPMIVAVEFTPEMTKPFEGEYITAVSTFLFDDPSLNQPAPTTAEAIVYASTDGRTWEEVTRQPLVSEFDFQTVDETVAYLDNPVLIESGKKYRVGVRISDYDVDQAPIYYQASDNTVMDFTDLFSEDDGKTWDSASDYVRGDNDEDTPNANVNRTGNCVWPIRAHIAAQPVSAAEVSDVLYFDLFRDGEKVGVGNLYEPHSWVTLLYPYEGTYTLQAHYKGGVVSEMSEPLFISNGADVKEVTFTLGISTGKGSITINGECLGATVYDMSGKVAAATKGNVITGLPAGVYILKAEVANGVETYKVVVK